MQDLCWTCGSEDSVPVFRASKRNRRVEGSVIDVRRNLPTDTFGCAMWQWGRAGRHRCSPYRARRWRHECKSLYRTFVGDGAQCGLPFSRCDQEPSCEVLWKRVCGRSCLYGVHVLQCFVLVPEEQTVRLCSVSQNFSTSVSPGAVRSFFPNANNLSYAPVACTVDWIEAEFRRFARYGSSDKPSLPMPRAKNIGVSRVVISRGKGSGRFVFC